MRRITLEFNGYVVCWSGGSFIAVWRQERQREHVPDFMVPIPESANRSRLQALDIERIAKEDLE